jgi:hypothetical protein
LRVGHVLARALEYEAKRRPRAGEFAHELSEALAAQALNSPIARLWAHLVSSRRSRRWMLAGSGSALAGAAAGGWVLRNRLTPLSPEERVIDYPPGASDAMAGFVFGISAQGPWGLGASRPPIWEGWRRASRCGRSGPLSIAAGHYRRRCGPSPVVVRLCLIVAPSRRASTADLTLHRRAST